MVGSLAIIQLEMLQVELEAHELLCPVMQIEVNDSGGSFVTTIVDWEVQFEFVESTQVFVFK